MFSKLRKFDAYPKTLEDFRVKTFSGAAVSIAAMIIMVLLFASELNSFLKAVVFRPTPPPRHAAAAAAA